MLLHWVVESFRLQRSTSYFSIASLNISNQIDGYFASSIKVEKLVLFVNPEVKIKKNKKRRTIYFVET